jgi:hypothetical protein
MKPSLVAQHTVAIGPHIRVLICTLIDGTVWKTALTKPETLQLAKGEIWPSWLTDDYIHQSQTVDRTIRALSPTQEHQCIFQQSVTEAHARLDAAGVPSADGVTCDDPNCNSKLGHRITVLLAERDGLRQSLCEVVQAMRDYEMDVEGPAPEQHRALMARALAYLEKNQ